MAPGNGFCLRTEASGAITIRMKALDQQPAAAEGES